MRAENQGVNIFLGDDFYRRSRGRHFNAPEIIGFFAMSANCLCSVNISKRPRDVPRNEPRIPVVFHNANRAELFTLKNLNPYHLEFLLIFFRYSPEKV